MGYRGKTLDQAAARALRAQGCTLAEIAEQLAVSKSSVSLWVRNVAFTPSPRRTGPQQRPNRLRDRRLAEIAELDAAGIERIGVLSEAAFLAAGVALYAGEGSKTEGAIKFANSDASMMRFFCTWLRHFFVIDERRLRVAVYLHEGLDLDAAEAFWARVTGIPHSQFRKAYRATPDPSIRRNKHEFGCAYVSYCCTRTHRTVMGLVRALLSGGSVPG